MGLIDSQIARQRGQIANGQLVETNLGITGRGTLVMLQSNDPQSQINTRTTVAQSQVATAVIAADQSGQFHGRCGHHHQDESAGAVRIDEGDGCGLSRRERERAVFGFRPGADPALRHDGWVCGELFRRRDISDHRSGGVSLRRNIDAGRQRDLRSHGRPHQPGVDCQCRNSHRVDPIHLQPRGADGVAAGDGRRVSLDRRQRLDRRHGHASRSCMRVAPTAISSWMAPSRWGPARSSERGSATSNSTAPSPRAASVWFPAATFSSMAASSPGRPRPTPAGISICCP